MKNTKFETSNGWVFNLRPNNIQQAYSFDVVLSDRDCKTLSGMMLRIAELEAENKELEAENERLKNEKDEAIMYAAGLEVALKLQGKEDI